ncbi:signal peptide peptidase SppA [Candidatus Enterovibrio escicola]|uniref:Signal peptide peptidase SppA n=1 Tax=Candidatus Enterovibrio escicola TaxID=1927127 RepID=A0A2A5T3T6_9GAMM|nr:signal peptide peptidase SppA [Candidatus Enterovibrio escacola]PCS22835.1 Signal peptide peptidase SppA [Candidatus Enterovibrio escacola]
MKKLFKILGSVLKTCWKILSFTRQLLLNLLFIGVIVAIHFALTAKDTPVSGSKEQLKRVLFMDLSGSIVEKRRHLDPFDLVTKNLMNRSVGMETVLFDVVEKIRAAAQDDNINGMVLSLSDMSEVSLTKLRYMAKAINEFKKTSKPVIAIGDHYNQSQYYLSSYADEIFMAPDGAVLLRGYGTYNLYFKKLLKNLDITTHVFRVGIYKSFVEPYTRTEMSQEAREANAVWLNQLWSAFVGDVANNRGIAAETLSQDSEVLLDMLKVAKGDFAKLSQNLGLVDELLTRQQIRTKLADMFGSDGEDSFNYVSIYDYNITELKPPKADQIAVVVASGVIINGYETEGTVGGDTTAALLRESRLDDAIKTVILRVDSTGGSAFASEVIRNEVEALKEAGKPVVVSMSGVAASGGYWIATSATQILAQPITITGSIGIFGILTTFEDALAKYGVYSDGVGTTMLSGVGVTRALPEEVSKSMQMGIENGYQRFIELVARQRNLSIDNMDHVAQGRIWTGYDAMKLGLVDQMGDFDDAVVVAAKLANIDDYSLNWIEEPLQPAQQFIYDMISQAIVTIGVNMKFEILSVVKQFFDSTFVEINNFNNLNDPNGRYTMCPNCSYYEN